MRKISSLVACFSLAIAGVAQAGSVDLSLALQTDSIAPLKSGTQTFISSTNRSLGRYARIDQSYQAADAFHELSKGKADIAVISTSQLSELGATKLGVFDLPFLFDSADFLKKIQKSPAGAELLSSLHTQGLVGLGFWNAGMSQLFGAPVHEIDDLRGMKVCILRVPRTDSIVPDLKVKTESAPTELASAVLANLGASAVKSDATPSKGDSTSSSCEQKSDAVEADAVFVDQKSMPATKSSLTLSGFRPNVYVIVMREDKWDALTSRVQEQLVNQVNLAADNVSSEVAKQEDLALTSLQKKGYEAVADVKTITKPSVDAWYSAAGLDNQSLIEFILSTKEQSLERQHKAPSDLFPDKRGEIGSNRSELAFRVLFGTDRRDDRDEPSFRFANTPGGFVLGSALVQAQSASGLRNSTEPSSLQGITILTEADFDGGLKDMILHAKTKRVLIYVHGYRNTFTDAALSAREIADRLNPDGVTLFYSWPSNGSAPRYASDEDRVLAGRDDFIRFLQLVKNASQPASIDILSHSMGARLATFAFDLMSHTSISSTPSFREVILAAPDIYVDLFNKDLDAFRRLTGRTTIYASTYDTALMCSEFFHQDRRVGQAGNGIFIAPGIDTVDASEVEQPAGNSVKLILASIGCTGSGHGYYVDNRSVQGDIQDLISSGSPPENRRGLKRAAQNTYWIIKPLQ